MSSAVALDRPVSRGGPVPVRRMVGDHLRHAVVDLWRQKVVALFIVVVPLVWLVVMGFLAGNAVLEGGGVRVMQFVTPSAAAMGVLYASFPTVAISVAEARHTRVLHRWRSTPLPPAAYLAARVGAAVVFAVVSVAVMLAVGVVLYDVQVVGSTIAATALTLVLGMACFAAVGMAVAAWAPTVATAQAASIGSAVALTFVSGLFTFGGSWPGWLETLGDLLPLKPFTAALQDQMNPYHPELGWDVAGVAVVVGWTALAVVAAVAGLRHEPGRRAGTRRSTNRGTADRRPRVPVPSAAATRRDPVARSPRSTVVADVLTPGRPRRARLVLDQAAAGARATWRDPGALFFAVVMPVGLYAFVVALSGGQDGPGGLPTTVVMAASMVAWGAAVAAFMNLPEAVAVARDAGVLARLRAAPLEPWHHLAGRTVATLGVVLLVEALVLVLGAAAYDLRPSAGGLLIGTGVVLLGTLVLGACGFLLAAVVPGAKAVGAVALVVLLPLAFFSDVFIVGGPAWMGDVGAIFPLKHLQDALELAWAPQPAVGWGHLAVLLLWGVVAGVLAARLFRWDLREC
ncbi:ABC transporter permease [Actinotalea sp. Marseille-Q4924]|uniref:ABC transporter permease n=1 Tax=Actinotalea sp. Marseille-Q4924 TaxID=2866571 RepID=UPI001CE4348B|nr:ABC transporter permease [Actinotalea sp. Marseille-Q4924]